MSGKKSVTTDGREAVRFTVTLDPVHHIYPLEQLAKKDDRSVGYLVRKAIEAYVKEHPYD